MNGRDFLTLAQTLATSGTEAAWRSAISRAYYGAFHVARELLENLRFVVPRGDQAHAYLWLRLYNCGDPQVGRAGSELNQLRGERNRADYDLHRPISSAVAASQAQAADRVIQILDATAALTTRAQITDAMKIYERDVLKQVTWKP